MTQRITRKMVESVFCRFVLAVDPGCTRGYGLDYYPTGGGYRIVSRAGSPLLHKRMTGKGLVNAMELSIQVALNASKEVNE